MALKTSVLVFYLRLSKNTQQVLRMASWVVLVIVNVAGVVLTLLNVFQCRPVYAAFNAYSGDAQCIPLLTEFICSAPVNIVTDLAILALPIPVLTGMRLPKRQKYILVFTFSLGVFVTIVDVVRIYYLQQAISSTPTTGTSSDPTAIFGDSPEFAWNASLSLMWSAVEVNVGMICACIPTLKPLIIKFLPTAIIDPDGTQNSDLSTYATGSQEKGTGPGTSPQQKTSEPPTSPRAPPDGLITPAPAHPESAEEQMDFLEFLTVPDTMNARASPHDQLHSPALPSPATRSTWLSHGTRRDSALYFGFVNMKRPKSMIKTSPSESLHYCIIVTVLFLLWGFSYGLLNTLNQVIASIANMSTAETIGLTSAYFGGGYFFGPLIVGEWVLRHDEHARFHHRRHKHRDPVGGFKATFIMGLAIYGIGTIMFWPCAVLTSFPGFIISNFVVGFGLAVLETAANPFIILCGPPQYAEARILVAQGFQGVATVLSGVLAQKVFFVNLPTGGGSQQLTAGELLDVQWTYLAITLFCVALALFFYYMPLPEVRDAELGRAAQRLPVDPKKRSGVGGLQLRTVMIMLAVLAQWTYVAAQESMSIFFRNLITAFLQDRQQSSTSSSSTTPTSSDWPAGLALSVTDYLLLAHAAFTLSRFNAAHIAWLGVRYPRCRFIPTPRTMLTGLTALSILTALLCVLLKPYANPNLIAVPAILFFFAEGPLWPLIFALGLRGQGDRTKRASAWLTMAASGPAVWPFVMYGVVGGDYAGGGGQTAAARRLQLAFVVVVVLLLFTLAYPVFLTVMRDARDIVDNDCKGGGAARGRGAGGGLGGLEEGGGGDVTSGRTTRDQSLNPAGLTRASTASTGVILGLADRVRALGKKKREKWRKGSESSSGGSPQFEHWEMRRDSGHGGLETLGENREGDGDGVPPDTIPEER